MNKTLLFCISSLVLVFVTVGGYVYAYKYLNNKLEKVLAMESGSSEKVSQESRQGVVHDLFVSTSADREDLAKYFVRQDEVAQIVERMERLGKEERVDVEVSGIGVGEQSVSDTPHVYPVDITLQAQGSRLAVEAFLKRAEVFPAILFVKDMSLEKLQFVEGKEERWRLALNFRIGMIR